MPKRKKPNEKELRAPPSIERLQRFVSELTLRVGRSISSDESANLSDELVGRQVAVMEGLTAHDVRVTARRHMIGGDDVRDLDGWLRERAEDAKKPARVYADEGNEPKDRSRQVESKPKEPSESELDAKIAEHVAKRLRQRGNVKAADAMEQYLTLVLGDRLSSASLDAFTSWLERRGKRLSAPSQAAAGYHGLGVGSMADPWGTQSRRGVEQAYAMPPSLGSDGGTTGPDAWALSPVPTEHISRPKRGFALRGWEQPVAGASTTASASTGPALAARSRPPTAARLHPIPDEELDPRLAVRGTSRGLWRSNLAMAGGFGGMLFGERAGALGTLAQQASGQAAVGTQPSVAVEALRLYRPEQRHRGAPGYGDEGGLGLPDGGTGLPAMDGSALQAGPGMPFGADGASAGYGDSGGFFPGGTPDGLTTSFPSSLDMQLGSSAMPSFPEFPDASGAFAGPPMVFQAGEGFGGQPSIGDGPAGFPGSAMPRVSPTFAQVTVLAPPPLVESQDLHGRGAAMEFEWAQLARQAGQMDASGFEQMQALLPPGTQLVYPALPLNRLPLGAVNLNLAPEVAGDLAGRAYGSKSAEIAERSALVAHASTGGTPSAVPLQAAFVPSIPPIGGLMGPAARTAFGPKADGDPLNPDRARPALEFMGLKVRLAPQLGAIPDIGSIVALQRPSTSIPFPIKSEKFGSLKQGLLRSPHDVAVRPDAARWQKEAPRFGLSEVRGADASAAEPAGVPRIKVAPISMPIAGPSPGLISPRALSSFATPAAPQPPSPSTIPGPAPRTPPVKLPAVEKQIPIPSAGGAVQSSVEAGSKAAPGPATPAAPAAVPGVSFGAPAIPSPMSLAVPSLAAAASFSAVAPSSGTPASPSQVPAPQLKPPIGLQRSMTPLQGALSSPSIDRLPTPSPSSLPGPAATPGIGAANEKPGNPPSPGMNLGAPRSGAPPKPGGLGKEESASRPPLAGSFNRIVAGSPPRPTMSRAVEGWSGEEPSVPRSQRAAGSFAMPDLSLPTLGRAPGAPRIGSSSRFTHSSPDRLSPNLSALYGARPRPGVSVQRATSGAVGPESPVGGQREGAEGMSNSDRGANAAEVSMLANEVWTILKRRLHSEADRRGRW